MSEPRKDSERLLRAVVTGELAESDPRVQALLETDPEQRARLSELQELQGRVDTAARFEQEILDDAEQRSSAPGLDRVRATLEREFDSQRDTSGPRSPRSLPREPTQHHPAQRVLFATLGVVLVTIVLVPLLDSPEDSSTSDDTELSLQADEFTSMTAGGPTPEASTFRWSFPLVGDGSFRLLAEDEGESGWTIRSPDLLEPDWSPDPETLSTWPSQIRWRVIALDADRVPMARSDWQHWDRSSD